MTESLASPGQFAADTGHSPEYDETFLHARREAIAILVIWLAALLWAVPYCYLNGYLSATPADTPMPKLELLFGMPRWVVIGVALPWLVADVLTVWICFVYMQDDDLGEDPEPPAKSAINTAANGEASA